MATVAPRSKRTLVRLYLAFRRNLGYQMRSAELLFDFAKFADREAPGKPLTTALAIQWATRVSASPKTRASRLSMVRGFAKYCASLDSRTQIPDTYLLGPSFQRLRPHLFSPAEIRLLMQRARGLKDRRSPLHALTYETLIGLLATTGIRPGEALRVQCRDLDADQGTLSIRRCKFSPERVIPLHSTTVDALDRYRQTGHGAIDGFSPHICLGDDFSLEPLIRASRPPSLAPCPLFGPPHVQLHLVVRL
jgi:integrase